MSSDVPRVLVVEDHADLAELLQEALGMRGIPVSIVNDPAEGVLLYCALRPRLTLVDLRLATGSGLDVARGIRREPAPHGMVVAMTGLSGPEIQTQALEAGFDRMLLKPFDLDVLNDLVDDAFARVG